MAIALVVAGFVLLASGIGIGWTIGKPSSQARSSGTITRPLPRGGRRGGSGSQGRGPQLPGGGTVSGINVNAVAAKVDPAVVDINTIIAVGVGGARGGTAAGTGMILTATGEAPDEQPRHPGRHQDPRHHPGTVGVVRGRRHRGRPGRGRRADPDLEGLGPA